MAVVQGVGYPNPNRSHFRSTEIWQTAVGLQPQHALRLAGQYFDHCCQGAPPTVGVSIGGQTPQAFSSPHPTGVSFANPEQYRWIDNEPPTGRDASAAEHFSGRSTQPEAGRRDMSGGVHRHDHIGRRGGDARRDLEFARLPRTHRARRAAFQRQGARNRAQDPSAGRAIPTPSWPTA